MYGDIFYRFSEARRQRRLQRLSEGLPEYLLRDLGLERDPWGRVHRAPVDPKK